jgi:hypothetical protein
VVLTKGSVVTPAPSDELLTESDCTLLEYAGGTTMLEIDGEGLIIILEDVGGTTTLDIDDEGLIIMLMEVVETLLVDPP